MEGIVGLKESCWHTMQSAPAMVSRKCESEISPSKGRKVFEKGLLINLEPMSLEYKLGFNQKNQTSCKCGFQQGVHR
jgi:hypothetical protein